jgi:hypothetical protein
MVFDKVTGCDLFEENLQSIPAVEFAINDSFYVVVDAAIDDVMAYLMLSELTSADITKAYTLLSSLLAVRFEHLETLVYPETWLAQEHVFKEVGCIGFSGTFLAKVNAGGSRWSGKCRLGRKQVLFMDEFQYESMEKVFVQLKSFDAAVLVGDWRQAPRSYIDCDHQRQPLDFFYSGGNEHRANFTAPLKAHAAWEWSQGNVAVQRIEADETFRTYEPALTLITDIFGSMGSTCCVQRTAAAQSRATLFLPVWAAGFKDWSMNSSGEKVFSLIQFKAMAVVLALEIVTSMSSPETYLIAEPHEHEQPRNIPHRRASHVLNMCVFHTFLLRSPEHVETMVV